MRKILLVILNIYAFAAEIIGSFVIIMFILSLFGHGKFEVGHGDWTRCFGNCQKVEKVKEGENNVNH